MEESNMIKVQKGFEIFHPALAGYIGKLMNNKYRGQWWNEILYKLSDQTGLPVSGTYQELIDSLDIANCLRLIDREWNDVFRYELTPTHRAWAKELMGARNDVSHVGVADIALMNAERYLDTMVRFCSAIDIETAEDIKSIYDEVRMKSAPETVIKTETVYIPTVSDKPTEIDVVSEITKVGVVSSRENIDLLKLVDTDVVQKTTLTRKVTFAGETKSYPVYKVRLDALYYNDQNDRIATWISKHKSENGDDSLVNVKGDEYNDIIENYIFDSNPDALIKTQKNINAIGQREAGVTLNDGRIVDGNRRFTCLRRIQKTSGEPQYFETVIMDLDINKDKKQIKLLELAIQHGEESKVDYDLIDYAVGTYNDIVITKLLTEKEYSDTTNESISSVKKRIEIVEIIREFLNYIKMPEAYYVAKDYQVYSLIDEMLSPLKKLDESDQKKLKIIAFNNSLLKAVLDQRKFIRDIKNLVSGDSYVAFFEKQMKLNEKIHIVFDTVDVVDKKNLDNFAMDNKAFADEFRKIMENTLLENRSKSLKTQPIDSFSKSSTLLEGIDLRTVGSMDSATKESLKKEIESLEYIVDGVKKAANLVEEKKSMASDFSVAQFDSTKPFIVCVNCDSRIINNSIVLNFRTISTGSNCFKYTDSTACFIDSTGRIVSSVVDLKMKADSECSKEFTISSSAKTDAKLRLVVQDNDSAENEASIVIPFEII